MPSSQLKLNVAASIVLRIGRIQGRNIDTIVRHLVALSPGVSGEGFPLVPPQSF